jgi:hypothetical protein
MSNDGDLRWNQTIGGMELFTKNHWQKIDPPKSWQEWFEHYQRCADHQDIIPTKEYLTQEMLARYPGNYTVEWSDDSEEWSLVFNSGQDETWFMLKYQ